MWLLRTSSLRVILFLIGSLPFLRSQTPFNSYLYGILVDQLDAPSISIGHGGLTPSYRDDISLTNPATWPRLKFAVLSGHYGGGDLVIDGPGFRSTYGRLSYTGFILPVNRTWAFGLGMRPYSRKDFLIEDNLASTVIFSEDTLTFRKIVRGSGGISSLFMGAGRKVNDRLSIGLQWDFLTGVLNEDTEGHLEGILATYRRHFEVKGTLVSLSGETTLLDESLPTTAYIMVRVPIGKGSLKETDYIPFFPSGLRQDLVRPRDNLSLPVELAGAVVTKVSDRLWASVELHRIVFGKNLSGRVSLLEGDPADAGRISAGLLRSGVRSSESVFGRLHYRVGFFETQHYISRSSDLLQERGLGFGIGIPFGPTENQIDLAFSLSSRKGFLSDEGELLRQLTVGLTLGDMWLVKGKRR